MFEKTIGSLAFSFLEPHQDLIDFSSSRKHEIEG